MITLDELTRHVLSAQGANVIAVDTETTGLNVFDGTDFAIGLSVAYRLSFLGVFSFYVPLRHEKDNLPMVEALDILKPLLREKPIVFHNARFDFASLKTLGITEFNPTFYDTMVMAHMVNEEYYSKRLDDLASNILKKSKSKDHVTPWSKMYGWASTPVSVMEDYAKIDAELTLELWEYFTKQMSEQALDGLWSYESRFMRLLINMESEGVGIDRDFLIAKRDLGLLRMDTLESVLGFSPSSRADLSNYLFDELNLPVLSTSPKTGKPSLDKSVMEQYDDMLQVHDNPSARYLLEWRGWQKAVTSLYIPMLTLERDGKIHCHFKVTGTKTGRLSCEKPNLQQIPRKSEKSWNGDARKAFNAGDPDYDLVGYDYSQLELRLAAAYGSEQRLISEFEKDDSDPFTVYSKIIGASRQDTKTFFYSNIYGAGTAKIAKTLGKSFDETKVLHEKFLESIPGIALASRRTQELAGSRRFVRYWTGRRRHFPYRKDVDEKLYKAFNSVLQGGAAELVKHAMLRLEEMQDDDFKMVLQIHDEIVFKVRRGKLDKYHDEIVKRMTDFPQFGVRFKTERKVWNA